MESALRNASSTNSSTVLPCAAVASVARWYNSSSTVNIDTQGTSLFSKPRRLTGVPPSRQTNVKRLPSLVDCPFATHSGSVHSSCPGQLQVSASALVAMQAGTRVAGEYSVARTCESARPIGSAPTTLRHAAMSLALLTAQTVTSSTLVTEVMSVNRASLPLIWGDIYWHVDHSTGYGTTSDPRSLTMQGKRMLFCSRRVAAGYGAHNRRVPPALRSCTLGRQVSSATTAGGRI
jgi:hypothetical protein